MKRIKKEALTFVRWEGEHALFRKATLMDKILCGLRYLPLVSLVAKEVGLPIVIYSRWLIRYNKKGKAQ